MAIDTTRCRLMAPLVVPRGAPNIPSAAPRRDGRSSGLPTADRPSARPPPLRKLVQLNPAVLRPAFGRAVGRNVAGRAVALSDHPAGQHALASQVGTHGRGAALRQPEVPELRPSAVRVPP